MNSAPRHGGNMQTLMANFGGTLADWIDCSTGIAPYAYPLPPLPVEVVQRLPHPSPHFLSCAAQYYGSEQVLPVAGSQAAICALPMLRAAGKVGVLRASYAEHAWRWQMAGHTVVPLNSNEIEYAVDRLDVLVLVNPNNPDGQMWSSDTLLNLHQRMASRGGWLIVDEAFMDCITPTQSLCADAHLPGLIVLRSVGKFFGLAGLRLGFVFAEKKLREQLASLLGPWSVSGPALWAGELALADSAWQSAQRERLNADADWLGQLLSSVGLPPRGSHPLMQFCPVKEIDQWGYALASNRIYSRPFNTQDIGVDAIRFGAVAIHDRGEFERRLRAAAQQISPAK
ncbi:threonine-phosphate decarboxylase [Chitinibacter bivalviorum]|uniref:Putative 8-amino-7-oxononanoate synthase n=1 Tax=Chitinibacter bivalviorum TaxID=2739434 RepID=A0A7H9BFG0_9NEIS|nr:threonine-phosphate decarboxylase CobD [Chitinibacter bivalviorum]QLG87440.1 threonine-phosphate decarboxylase [Chitinibacter bivalviorum]